MKNHVSLFLPIKNFIKHQNTIDFLMFSDGIKMQKNINIVSLHKSLHKRCIFFPGNFYKLFFFFFSLDLLARAE